MNIVEQLYIDGRTIKTKSGNEIILRGVSIADPEALNSYVRGRFLNLIQIMDIAIKDWNVNVLRIPIHPYGIDDQPGWLTDPNGYLKKHIDLAVKKSIESGIYLIIDLHLIENYDSEEVDKLVISFWKQIAPIYKDIP
ncbi:MAG: glycoside hydrolase family 5 protein, partial [Candidatus Goldbacteria bacterium]|nr:glycoside hydrolase family 5 protein [Candidatus Goldiibacteriota bacterium]